MDAMHEKLEKLKEYLIELGSVAIAFSSGVDSTFLLKVAHDTLGDNVIAVTAKSCSFPKRELDEAISFCEREHIEQIVIESEELSIEGFRQNPKNRCYMCKHELFEKMGEAAKQRNIVILAEGSNMDDNGDYRPGLQAVAELGVKSPLRYAGLYKDEIRSLSKEMGLETWNKQSFAYGETISEEKLGMVDKAEQLLLDMGFSQVRVRIHDTIARIELMPKDFERLISDETRTKVYKYFKELGFSYVTMDLMGYRTGSMNEVI